MRSDVGNSRSARDSWPAVYRSLRRPEATGFLHSIVESTRPVDVVTPAGLYLGRRPGFSVDLLRVQRVLGRIVWGLFLHHFGRRLPEDMVAAVYSVTDLHGGELEHVVRVVAPLRDCEEHVIGGDVFAYRFQATIERPDMTAWVLRFYEAAEFVVITVPRAAAPGPPLHGFAPPLGD